MSALCPNINEFDRATINSYKNDICCYTWKGADYVTSCGDAIGGYANTTVTCSGSLGSRGSFSCCSKVYADGTAQYVGLRCTNLETSGAEAPSQLWRLRKNAGGVIVAVVTLLVVAVL